MIGIDTDAIIDFYRKDQELIKLMSSIEDDLSTTIINYQEIMFGIDLSNKKHIEEKDYFDSFFNGVFFFSLDKRSCVKANEILQYLKKKGVVLGKFDCMIAGILLSNGVDTIITKNKKHFENIPGLKVLSY